MDDPTCENCKHFRQHYVYLGEERFVTVPCGHCVYPRLKHRRPDTLACVYFKAKTEESQSETDAM